MRGQSSVPLAHSSLLELDYDNMYMSTSCQPGSRVVRAFSDVEKTFLFSDLAVLTTKSENKKGFSMSEKARISIRVNELEQL